MTDYSTFEQDLIDVIYEYVDEELRRYFAKQIEGFADISFTTTSKLITKEDVDYWAKHINESEYPYLSYFGKMNLATKESDVISLDYPIYFRNHPIVKPSDKEIMKWTV